MKKLAPKIEGVEKPVVGRFYLVPCVWDENYGVTRRTVHKGGWWPVIGPWHEDADIGFAEHHFHFDVRFFTEWNWEGRGKRQNMARVKTRQPRELAVMAVPKIEYRRLKMLREMPDFPKEETSWAVAGGWVEGSKNDLVKRVEEKFKDVRMTCMKCPHRGMPLTGLPVKDGMVVCNGHGLRWELATGRMVVR